LLTVLPSRRSTTRPFDNHLIGIDRDGRVHVSERLLMLHDGPLLEQSLKATAGTTMRLPRRREHHPDRDRLATQFEQFKRVCIGWKTLKPSNSRIQCI
jgi:putative restriction endonuclease